MSRLHPLCSLFSASILLSVAAPCLAGSMETRHRVVSPPGYGSITPLPGGPTSATSRDGAGEKEILVAAHYAPWFQGGKDGWVGRVKGKETHTAYTPILGRYDNRNPAVLTQHVAWARAYGVDAFMIEWCGMRSGEFPNSLDYIVSLFPKNPSFAKIKFFFVYSFITGLRKSGEKTFDPVNFDDPAIVAKLISDVKYAARTYFPLANHLRIDGRPVIYLWATDSARGDFAAAVAKLRRQIKASFGYDPYIIGDNVGWNHPAGLDWAPALDAYMPYVMVRVDEPVRNYKLETIIDPILALYRNSRNICADLKRKFIPCAFAGLNPVGAPWCYDQKTGKLSSPVVVRSVAGFRDFISRARSLVDPDLRMFYLTSWSEWNEGTNLEPATQFGFDYLKAIKDLLTKAAPADLPKEPTVTFKFKRVWMPTNGDKRWLAAAFDRIEFLDAAGEVLLSLNIGTPAARPAMGAGWFPDEQGPWDDVANFCWTGDLGKAATLRLVLPAGTTAIRFKALQIENQSIAIYREGAKKADVPVDIPWTWVTYKASL